MHRNKIAIIELFGHSEIALNLSELLLPYNYDLSLFISTCVHANLIELHNLSNINWYVKDKQINVPNFIERHIDVLNSHDLVIFTTINSSFKYFSQLKLKNYTHLIIHNGNTFFDFWSNLSFAFPSFLKDTLRLGKTILKRETFYKMKMLKNFDSLSFAGSCQYHYFKASNNIPEDLKILESFPIAYSKFQENRNNNSNEYSIVIPGSMDSNRKDFKLLLDTFSSLKWPKNKIVCIHFVGAATDKKALQTMQEIKGLETTSLLIKYQNDPFSQTDFDDALKKADLFILPIRESYKLGICKEYYGLTNISGTINDIVKYGVPGVIPHFYPINPHLQALVTTFSSKDDLSLILTRFIKEEATINSLKYNNFLHHYSKENQSLKLKCQIGKMTSKQ